jgi:hypothetical protein
MLLGIPFSLKNYLNCFAEIQTGQGKSLILAVVSSYFALNGY